MDRRFIVEEIRRLARENDGRPPGREMFRSATGIPTTRWFGVHWATWSDAVVEAGFAPNAFRVKYDSAFMIDRVIEAARVLQKLPTMAELHLYAHSRPDFPHGQAFQRHFFNRRRMAETIKRHCHGAPSLSDVATWCDAALASRHRPGAARRAGGAIAGHVYLMKSGRHYKIGRTNHVGRREYQLALIVPEPVSTVHAIATDDPDGIEAYWHRRFRAKRRTGEWFSLTLDDVKAFRLRRFM